MKKENQLLIKKYEKTHLKLKQYDTELKMTRQQVSTFKIKFKNLMGFIKKKGGIEVLNDLPNIDTQFMNSAK